MEPQFQTSFIPKKPIVSNAPIAVSNFSGSGHSTVSIFNVICIAIFVVVIMAWGALFSYKIYLQKQISSVDQQISAARDAFQPETIKQLLDVSQKISSTKVVLENHRAVSAIIDFLESSTIRKMKFNSMSFSNKEGKIVLTLEGESPSYADIAVQSQIFASETRLTDQGFSSFDLTDTGNVKTTFSAVINPNMISYKEKVTSATE